jgi:hypothetical protein
MVMTGISVVMGFAACPALAATCSSRSVDRAGDELEHAAHKTTSSGAKGQGFLRNVLIRNALLMFCGPADKHRVMFDAARASC